MLSTKTRTPRSHEVDLLLAIDNGATLSGRSFRVPVKRMVGARPRWCTDNALALAQARGGKVVHCFDLTVMRDRFLELEAHAVTEFPDGTFIDPTPHPLGFQEICVVRSRIPFGEKLPPNRIVALTINPDDVEQARYFSAAHEIISEINRPGEAVTVTREDIIYRARDYKLTREPSIDDRLLAPVAWTLLSNRK